MRPVRLFLLLTMLTAAGIVAARPDAVLPVAGRFIEPLWAQQREPRPKPAGAIAKAVIAKPSAEPKVGISVGVALPNFAPSSHDLTFSGVDEDSGLGASAAPAPPGQPPSVALNPAAAASDASPNFAPITPQTPPPMAFPAAAPPKPVAALAPPNKPLPTGAKPPVGAGPVKPQPVAAKLMFGAARAPAPLASRAIGAYSRGCLAGGVALPVDGPAWQAMRLSRNRNWGHPDLIKLVQRFATETQKYDGWSGLLVGDISQPRGGPMLTGHASHQLGLDADVWLTPMPNKRRLSTREREEMSATSMLDKTDIAVDPKVFTETHVKIIKRAASYPQVERVLVHPAIKKALCEAAGTDRKWLGKVRPIGGHYYHFHIRIGCPPGFAGCKPQVPPTGEDGCGKEVEQWLARVTPSKTPPAPKPPGYKPPPPKPPLTLAQLPPECTAVLKSGPDGVKPEGFESSLQASPLPKISSAYGGAALRPHFRRLKAAAGAN